MDISNPVYGNMYNNLLIFISYEARYKEYHHQKLAAESRNFCHTPAYLATLLHSNNTKDVKESMAYIRKKCCKGSCCVNFIIVLKENVSFSMPLSVEVGVSVAAFSELLDESKSTFFLEFAGL